MVSKDALGSDVTWGGPWCYPGREGWFLITAKWELPKAKGNTWASYACLIKLLKAERTLTEKSGKSLAIRDRFLRLVCESCPWLTSTALQRSLGVVIKCDEVQLRRKQVWTSSQAECSSAKEPFTAEAREVGFYFDSFFFFLCSHLKKIVQSYRSKPEKKGFEFHLTVTGYCVVPGTAWEHLVTVCACVRACLYRHAHALFLREGLGETLLLWGPPRWWDISSGSHEDSQQFVFTGL